MGGKKHFRQDRNPQPPVPGQRGHTSHGQRQGGFQQQAEQLQKQLDKLRQQQRQPQQRQPKQTGQTGGWKRWTQPEWDAWRKNKADTAKSDGEEQGAGDSTEDVAKSKTDQLRSSVQKLHQVKALWEDGDLPDYIAEPLKSFWNDKRTELQEPKTPDVRHKLQLKKIEEQKLKIGRQQQKLEKDNQSAIAALQTAKESRDNVTTSEALLLQLEADLGPLAEAAKAPQPATVSAPTATSTAAQYLHGLEQVVQISPEVRAALQVLANAQTVAAAAPTTTEQPPQVQPDTGGGASPEAPDASMQGSEPPAKDTQPSTGPTAKDSENTLREMREQFLRAQAAAELAAVEASSAQRERVSNEDAAKRLEQENAALRKQLQTQQSTGRTRARSEPRHRSRSGSRRRKSTAVSSANLGNA